MKKLFLILLAVLTLLQLKAQSVAINNDGSPPNASALLDLKSNVKGLLIPRMTTTERNAVTVDITTDGLMVYDTDVKSFFYHNTTGWIEISTGVAGTNYWTLASNNINNNNSGNVGIGISGTNITEKFQVDANMKVGSAVWSSASNDRIIKFGDGNFVTIGEAGQDDRMTLTAKNFIFTPSSAYPGFIGINTTTPLAPLSFGNIIGEKINFWNTDATHNYGIGVLGGLLQVHTNDASADIVFGNGTSAAFNEAVRFTGSGKVGIGTSVPGSMLEIKAASGQADLEINAQSSGDNAFLKLNKGALGAAAQVRFKNGGVNTWDLGTNLDDRFKIRYTPTNATIIDIDNVTNHIGIFTNSFTEAVNIAGNVAAGGAFISQLSNAGFQFQDRTNNAYGGWNWYADNGKANLYRYSTGDVLTIDQLGKLGIGNNSPVSPLSFGNVIGEKINLWNTDATHNFGIGVQGALLQIHTNDIASEIAFGYGSSNVLTEFARMSNTVGVQTLGPNAGFWFKDRLLNTYAGWNWYATNGKANLYKYGFGDALTIDQLGNLGIGTTAPGAKLDVAGSIKITDGNQALGKVLVSDNNGIGSWQNLPVTNTEFRAIALSSVSLALGGSYIPQFLTEEYDLGFNFDGTNYIAPSDGIYHFDVSIRWYLTVAGAPFTISAAIQQNGTTFEYSNLAIPAGLSGGMTTNLSIDKFLNAGNLIRIICEHSSAINQSVGAASIFTGHRVN